MIFTYSQLGKFLQLLKDRGPVISFAEWDQKQKVALLRHDIDLSVVDAYNLFLFEKEMGVKSTFLFLTSCHTYNILSSENRMMIKEIADAGFDVGLHFDPLLYPQDKKLDDKARFEADIISFVTQKPVKTISLHNPSMHGLYPVFEGFINAYEKPFFDEKCYISDSRRQFKYKNPFTFIQDTQDKTVQVLLHPLHFSPTERTYKDILMDYYQDHFNKLDVKFREANNIYAEEVKEFKFL